MNKNDVEIPEINEAFAAEFSDEFICRLGASLEIRFEAEGVCVSEELINRTLARIEQESSENRAVAEEEKIPEKRKLFSITNYRYIAAAAAVIVVAGLGMTALSNAIRPAKSASKDAAMYETAAPAAIETMKETAWAGNTMMVEDAAEEAVEMNGFAYEAADSLAEAPMMSMTSTSITSSFNDEVTNDWDMVSDVVTEEEAGEPVLGLTAGNSFDLGAENDMDSIIRSNISSLLESYGYTYADMLAAGYDDKVILDNGAVAFAYTVDLYSPDRVLMLLLFGEENVAVGDASDSEGGFKDAYDVRLGGWVYEVYDAATEGVEYYGGSSLKFNLTTEPKNCSLQVVQ